MLDQSDSTITLGDRMKMYENIQSKLRFDQTKPLYCRIDGRNFSKFTKGMQKPFDKAMSMIMIEVTKHLVKETGAIIGYTQSDEISLIIYSDDYKKQTFFNGKIQKIVSIVSSLTTSFFNSKLNQYLPEKTNQLALFDCRAWSMPTLEEAANVILWREFDATKNSISMASRCYYSHKALYKKNGSEMQEMLFDKGINWNDYPDFFKRGIFIQRQQVCRKFSTDEIDKLPINHEARSNPDLMIQRYEIKKLEMPPFSKVINRVGVIFNSEAPIVINEKLII